MSDDGDPGVSSVTTDQVCPAEASWLPSSVLSGLSSEGPASTDCYCPESSDEFNKFNKYQN